MDFHRIYRGASRMVRVAGRTNRLRLRARALRNSGPSLLHRVRQDGELRLLRRAVAWPGVALSHRLQRGSRRRGTTLRGDCLTLLRSAAGASVLAGSRYPLLLDVRSEEHGPGTRVSRAEMALVAA